MLKISTKEEVQKYFDSEHLNQSSFKKLIGGIDAFLSFKKEDERVLYYEEKDSFIIGSAVDCRLLAEKKDFKETYYISTLKNKPSDSIMSITQEVFAMVCNDFEEVNSKEVYKTFLSHDQYRDYIFTSAQNHNYYNNYKKDTLVDKIIKEGSEYYNDIKLSTGKQVISLDDMVLITGIEESLKINPRTSKYFDRAAINAADYTMYYQLPIFFIYKGVKCKAMLDMVVVVEREGKQIVYPIDLKTTGYKTVNFLSSIRKFRYDMQAAWYNLALQHQFPNAEIMPFEFVVESTTKQGNPLIYKVSDKLLEIGRYGRDAVTIYDQNELFFTGGGYDSVIIKDRIIGFEELIDLYIFHEETGWVEDKIISDNEGVLEISWDGILNKD